MHMMHTFEAWDTVRCSIGVVGGNFIFTSGPCAPPPPPYPLLQSFAVQTFVCSPEETLRTELLPFALVTASAPDPSTLRRELLRPGVIVPSELAGWLTNVRGAAPYDMSAAGAAVGVAAEADSESGRSALVALGSPFP